MLDVRQPIGLLFLVYGVILVGSGLIHPEISVIPDHNISFNLDRDWGALMAIFGGLMLVLAARDTKKK